MRNASACTDNEELITNHHCEPAFVLVRIVTFDSQAKLSIWTVSLERKKVNLND